MRCEIEGELVEVQGCIERSRDIIEGNNWTCQVNETTATRDYSFFHKELGEVGKLKLSTLPKQRTELYSYYAAQPDDLWMLEYLPSHVYWDSTNQHLFSLLALYKWQVENNLFNLSSTELYNLGNANKPVDWGWEKHGLGDSDLRKKAEDEFQNWSKKIYDLRKKDLDQILDVIVTQIRLDGLSMKMYDGKSSHAKTLKAVPPKSSIAKALKRNVASIQTINNTKSRGPQLETIESLKKLREIRQEAIRRNRPIPKKAAAMDQAGITDKTWKKYDKELWAKWDDKNYKQEKQE